MGHTHPAVTAYEQATAGIPDCFDQLDAKQILEVAQDAAKVKPWSTPAVEADRFFRSHLRMLGKWHDALDSLDSDLRCDVVAGGLPDEQTLYLKTQALALFEATTALLRVIATYHYGSAGPALSADYGHAYALSNSALSPF